MLPRVNRLSSAQFERAFGRSQSVRHPLISLRVHRRFDDSKIVRAAFVVPKKQGKATARNLVRRRLRERFRMHPLGQLLEGCDLIFLALPATHNASIAQLDEAIGEVLNRAKIAQQKAAGKRKSERENASRVENSP